MRDATVCQVRAHAVPAAAVRGLTVTAERIFAATQGLHLLTAEDARLLSHAASALRLIRSSGARWSVEHDLFRSSLAGLDEGDSVVVEAAACYAADLVVCDLGTWRRVGASGERRALWLAAVLRLADALCTDGAEGPEGVCAVWSDELVYLELDGRALSAAQLRRARARVAGLEALTGRGVIVGDSASRRSTSRPPSQELRAHLTGV